MRRTRNNQDASSTPPQAIQPYGCLLTCARHDLSVRRFSDNCADFLRLNPLRQGMELGCLLGPETVHRIINAVSVSVALQRPAFLFGVPLPDGQVYDVSVHLSGDEIVTEWEQDSSGDSSTEALAHLRTMTDRVRNVGDLASLCDLAVRLLKNVLRYERVMMFRLQDEDTGEIISEARSPPLESFLNKTFRLSDLSPGASASSRTSLIRILRDSEQEIIRINGDDLPPLSLQASQLGCAPEEFTDGMRLLGVRASLTISLVVDGTLWGVLICHSSKSTTPALSERIITKIFGEFVALRIMVILRTGRLMATHRTHSLADRFLRDAASMTDMLSYLRGHIRELMSFIPCEGIATLTRGEWAATGLVPPESECSSLLRLAYEKAGSRIWHTSHLSGDSEGEISFLPDVAGVLILPISPQPEDYLFLFRQETVRTEHRIIRTGAKPGIASEEIRGESVKWTDDELEIAGVLRSSLIEILAAYHQQQMLSEENADLRQRMLNEELNHRVKNILAVVQSLFARPVPEGRTAEAQLEALRGRVSALAGAHDQLVRAGNGGWLRTLLENELTPYNITSDVITLRGPDLWLTGRSLSVSALVFHELATNAAKYGALSSREGRLDVRWFHDPATSRWVLTWSETGGPPVKPPTRTGFGSMLIRRAVPHELDGTVDVNFRKEGMFFRFEIPERHAWLAGEEEQTGAERIRPDSPPPQIPSDALAGASVLIAEDHLLIVMEAEQAIEAAGASVCRSVASVSSALAALNSLRPDVAVLDVNLGDMSSISLARILKSRGIPFLFTTGYADRTAIPDDFRDCRILRKPYSMAALISELAALRTENQNPGNLPEDTEHMKSA
ncbi:response regulator [Acetobacter sp. AN02]|uniref:HWE histidine kinase domain-containing protein n=1 Tax=Acetobacter sp. AN02 TaxID=2894186 RepID=UPI00243427CE|nr:HWE histidine kinase domain-containing protein [Acetobacter sp. AN02]MDG6093672.1 response regulator [Acetobacter sp. AN02]